MSYTDNTYGGFKEDELELLKQIRDLNERILTELEKLSRSSVPTSLNISFNGPTDK